MLDVWRHISPAASVLGRAELVVDFFVAVDLWAHIPYVASRLGLARLGVDFFVGDV